MEEPQEDTPPVIRLASYFDPWVLDVLGKLQRLSREYQRAMKSSNADDAKGMKRRMDELLDTLTERERKVFCLRLGWYNGSCYPLEDVAKQFRLTTARVVQIESNVLRKVGHPVRRKVLNAIVRSRSFKNVDWSYI